MSLFNFDENCYVCKCHRDRKAVVSNLIFPSNIAKNIVSYLSCYTCSKLWKYELECEKDEYKEYTKEAKLFYFYLQSSRHPIQKN